MNFKKNNSYLIPLSIFLVVAVAYFFPILKGYKLFQSDIQQFIGMSKEIQDFRSEYGKEPYWTNSAFGGMPSFQLSTYYPNDYLKKIDGLMRFLPSPADYLFLYFLGFFILLRILKFDWKLATIGSLAFGFSTYFIVILGVGHNAKAHAIGYMPIVISGFLLVFQKKYFKGFLLTTISMALEINANHPQMTYYMLFVLLIFGVIFLVEYIKNKKSLGPFFKATLTFISASVLSLGLNATSLLATKQYADYSTRGKSELTITPDGKEKKINSGLSKDYITEYSYGILETLNLFIPNFTGGGNSENLGLESNTYEFLSSKIGPSQAKQFSKNVPTYWGRQPIVAAPAYIGAIFIFLFVMGIFLVHGKLKKCLVATTIFSILLSWGHNFEFLTDLFIEYVPLYNKFRAVSSIQVLAEICIPLLGLLALKEFIFSDEKKEIKLKSLKKSFYIVGGIALFFTLFGTSLLGFEGPNDIYYNSQIKSFSKALIKDRRVMFYHDSLRTFLLVFFLAGVLFLFLKGKLKKSILLVSLVALLLFDMIGIARRYVNEKNFHKSSKIEKPFVKSAIDKEILKDKAHYRVANFTVNFMSDGATSYFHKSIGGYHAAKLRRYQNLVDFQISKNNIQVLNMLNTKYFILPNENGTEELQINKEANGNAWFVSDIKFVKSANEEILALTGINSKTTSIVNSSEFASHLENLVSIKSDSLATIKLVDYKTNNLKYTSESNQNQLAIFSEIYYKDGWNAYIDGAFVPHLRANYVLRALYIPKGKHSIEFKFEPAIIRKGNTIVLISSGLLFLFVIGRFIRFF